MIKHDVKVIDVLNTARKYYIEPDGELQKMLCDLLQVSPDALMEYITPIRVDFTEHGQAMIDAYKAECAAKRKEILDAGKDTGIASSILVTEDVADDILAECVGGDAYDSTWAVTDNCEADTSLYLEPGLDFEIIYKEVD